jgi:hypothetical protein
MPKTIATPMPSACSICASTQLQRRITTYPLRLSEPPQLAGKEIHIGRVALFECQSCGHLMPTAAGQAKVNRCLSVSLGLMRQP